MSRVRLAITSTALSLLYRLRKSRSTPENGNRRAAVAAVDGAIVIVMLPVTAAVGVSMVGEKLHVAPTGRPEQLNFSCWLNPFCGIIVRPICPEVPGARVIVVWVNCSEKSCGAVGGVVAGAVTMTLTGAEVDAASLVSPL
jgi:hypothetical protein